MYHKSMPFAAHVREYIRRHALVRAGDRVAVAVSGGADSVALLRLLLELRSDLGVVLLVLHFHHGIRGADADADQQFVAQLAAEHGLEFRAQSGDAPAHADEGGLSLETAARELRYSWFRELLRQAACNRVATAHTLDDQAETVLMRMLRGAGSRGLAGIYPEVVWKRATSPAGPTPSPHTGKAAHPAASIIRPLLTTRRVELVDYLRALGQPWREDPSNLDTRHLRNRIRHQLLPLLERDFNPQVAAALATQAEIARVEEEYWQRLVAQLLPAVQTCVAGCQPGKDEVALSPEALLTQPLALQRRLLRAAVEPAGLRLDFDEVEQVLLLASANLGHTRTLPQGWRALREPGMLRLQRREPASPPPSDYEYLLPVPGEVAVAELGSVFRASLVPPAAGAGEYNALLPKAAGTELVVRNWRAGDRFRPAHTRSPRKVKTLLQGRQVASVERKLWPVVLSGSTIVWMRGFSAAEPAAAPSSAAHVRIDEVRSA